MVSRDGHEGPPRGMYPWLGAYRGHGGVSLAGNVFRRMTEYQSSIANLTRQGSVEPRLWIGAFQSFWSGLAGDYGDFLRSYGGREDGADPIEVAAEGPLIIPVPIKLDEGSKIDEQFIDLPQNLLAASATKATLVTRGLFLGTRCLLRPGYHLILDPKEITSADRRFRLRFKNLPDDLTAGMTLLGTVVAQRAHLRRPQPDQDAYETVPLPQVLVAIIQAKVI